MVFRGACLVACYLTGLWYDKFHVFAAVKYVFGDLWRKALRPERFGVARLRGQVVTSINPLAEYMRTTKTISTTSTEFLWRDSASNVTFTAPHAKAVFRDGEYKRRDTNVGILAVEAARLAGSNALLALTPGDLDGNHHASSQFRRALSVLVPAASVIFDIHGMTDAHGFDVVVGTCNAGTPTWLSDLVAYGFTSAGLTVDVRGTGDLSAGPTTITAAMLDLGHQAVQIEVAHRWRDGKNNPALMGVTIDVLAGCATTAKRRLLSGS